MIIVHYQAFGIVIMLMLIFDKIVHFQCLFGLYIYLIFFTILIFFVMQTYVNIILLADKEITVNGKICIILSK